MKWFSKLTALLMFTAVVGMMFAAPYAASAEVSAEVSADTENDPLYRGMISPDVEELQHVLKDFQYYDYEVDSIFGPITFHAVKEFQEDYGLKVDGIVGPVTSSTLDNVVSRNHTYKGAPQLNRGDEGEFVKVLQTQLQKLNYYHGKIDGHFGPLTDNAVRKFQRANHIDVDGFAGPVTYASLIENPVRWEKPEHTEKVKSASTSKSSESEEQQEKTANVSRNADDDGAARTFYVESTAYTAYCPGCSGITATGINLKANPDAKVIAVDPDVIPLGSTVWVEGYGYAIAGDTGGAIDGRRIDVFIPDHSDAMRWGRRTVKIKVFE